MTIVGIALIAFCLGWLTADYLKAVARPRRKNSRTPW